MAFLHAGLIFIVVFDPGFCHVLGNDDSKVLKWPAEYSFRGEITDLFTGIIKPFEFWYSKELNKSRVDYYGGIVKTYYIAENDEDYGKIYEIYPTTTDTMTNEIVCNEQRNNGEQLNFLKSNQSFTYIGQKIYNNKEVEVWKLLDIEEDEYIEKKKEETLYVYLNDNENHLPVFREKITHNMWTGGIDDHVIIRFFDFKDPYPKDLDVTQVEACHDTVFKEFHHSLNIDSSFFSFKMQHSKKYKVDEHKMRKQIFQKNLRRVIEHNRKNLGYKLTINKFSDLTDDELSHLAGTRPSNPKAMGSIAFPHTEEEIELFAQNLPKNYDMRVEGLITSVKNQGECGSCWAFSTTAAVEGALARNNGARNLELSEQSLVDCAWGFGNYGCNGGMMNSVFMYVLKNGIPMDESYGPYLEVNGFCGINNMTDVYRIKGFSRVPALSENAMKMALYNYGPVTVTINSQSIHYYSSGVFYDANCNNRPSDHAVTVVGYGVRDGTTYWIVKNSWGEDWGQDGYILFSANNNNCHILEDAFFPIV